MGATGLEFQTVDVPFDKGLDTKTQRKLVIPGKWDSLENLTLTQDGTPRTRDGMTPLVATANGNGLALYNKELLTISGPTASSVSTATAAATANVRTGLIGNVQVSKTEINNSQLNLKDTPDCATGGGFTLYAWREKTSSNVTTGVKCTLVDEATGTHLISSFALRTSATVGRVRTVFNGSTFLIFYIQGTSLYCRTIFASAPTVVNAETALITSASLNDINYDAVAFGTNGAAVVYGWNDGTTSVRTIEAAPFGFVSLISAGPTNLISEANATAASITSMCCAVSGNGLLCAAFITSTAGAMAGLSGAVFNTSFAVTTAATLVSGVVTGDPNLCRLTAVASGTTPSPGFTVFRDESAYFGAAAVSPVSGQFTSTTLVSGSVIQIVASNTYASGTNVRGVQGPFIHGKAFVSGGRIYLPVYVYSNWNAFSSTSPHRTFNAQNTFFVLDTGLSTAPPVAGVVVGKALYGGYALATLNQSVPTVGSACSSPATTDGFATISGEATLLVLTQSSTGVSANVSPMGLVRLTMSPNSTIPQSNQQIGESLVVAGGSASAYDGELVVEQGFNLYPEGIYVSAAGAGSGVVTAGTHQLVAIYEWSDNAGQRYQSAPSPAVQVSCGVNDNITVVVPTLQIFQRASIQIVIFMTQANGLAFNRILTTGGVYTATFNTTAAAQVSISVNEADTTFSGNELLYTQPNFSGTALPNIAIGPSTSLAVCHNRLWFDQTDQPGNFGYSQERVNNVGLQTSPDLGGVLPSDAGRIEAISSMDEKVLLFTGGKIFVVFGTGPNSSGGFNGYSDPQELPSDVGCSDPFSVLKMPSGLIFKSQKGWHLLGRDLTVKYIGEGVERWNSQTVTAAVLLGDRQECRFVTNGDTYGPVTLVYSYECQGGPQWSSFRKSVGSAYAPVDAVWWPTAASGAGRYVHISAAVGLNQDTPGLYVDQPGAQSAVGVTTVARTSWLRLGQLEAFQRVRWLYLTAAADAAPVSSLAIAVDYDDAYGALAPGAYTVTVPLATAFAGWAGESIDLRHKLRRQKCKSVAFTFTETPPSGDAGIVRLSGIQALALQLGLKRGTNKLMAKQSV